jgi:uncharacterized damage-inducible protein DinB
MGDNTLREVLYGKGAHVDPVACVEDVSEELAARTLAGYPHSIWQIVAHMNYWMDYDLGKIARDGRPYPEKAIESWPENPDPGDDAHFMHEQWQAVTRRFPDLLARVEFLAESNTSELARKVKKFGPGQTSLESTVHAMLWQIAAHNSYHAGQIALLRRLFGAWPPRRGGDTW